MRPELFGFLPDGRPVERVTLRCGGLTARILTYGCVLQDLRLHGHAPSLVLGFERLSDYLAHSWFFGATVGRCANRIAGAAFPLDGMEYRLDPNFLGRHHLHGGGNGTGTRLWAFEEIGPSTATLRIDLADGDMGYPGALTARARFALMPAGTFDIWLTATTDRPTLCNLAHHSYWNLSGAADVRGHRLQVAADHFLPVDAELIPTGEVAAVAGTRFDFRAGVRLGEACGRGSIDHNLCLSDRRVPIREVGTLAADTLAMSIRTTEPGLQIFDAAPLDLPVAGTDGRRLGAYAGIAIEPQVWPDAIHHPGWPQATLRPGERYAQHSQFIFRNGV